MKALGGSSEWKGKGGWERPLLQVESGGSLWEKSSGDTQGLAFQLVVWGPQESRWSNHTPPSVSSSCTSGCLAPGTWTIMDDNGWMGLWPPLCLLGSRPDCDYSRRFCLISPNTLPFETHRKSALLRRLAEILNFITDWGRGESFNYLDLSVPI